MNVGSKRYLLAVLAVILAFNYVDRLTLGLVLQNIKQELHLSDTELGFLGGLSFAFFYSIMGLPIARWVDRGNRIKIIALTTLCWSVAVALSGFVTTFVQLLLVRVVVAVGEAGCIPPAHSLISSRFDRAERPKAVALYMLGAPLSVVIGYFIAGWINEIYGWRMTFVLLGLPGLALALIAFSTLTDDREKKAPASHPAGPLPSADLEQASIRETVSVLLRSKTFRYLVFCFSIVSFFGYGILQWQPAFFQRSYGLSTGEIGTWFTLIYGVGGVIGTYGGGAIATRFAPNDEALQLRVMSVMYSAYGAFSILIYGTHSKYVALGLMFVGSIVGASVSGPLFATIQTLVPERTRATSIALIYFFANLIGMGLGPLVAGSLSDLMRSWAGDESLRYALLMLSPGYAWGGWYLWKASRSVTADIHKSAGLQESTGGRDGTR